MARDWLTENHAMSLGVWLVFYKKSNGNHYLVYPEAMEEALSTPLGEN